MADLLEPVEPPEDHGCPDDKGPEADGGALAAVTRRRRAGSEGRGHRLTAPASVSASSGSAPMALIWPPTAEFDPATADGIVGPHTWSALG